MPQNDSPEGNGRAHTPSALAILDAAEELFCTRGFAGVSMRDIASASGQHLASANYYFGSKAGLFEAVFLRRIVPVNRRRLEILEAYEETGRTALPDVVEAYLRPLFEAPEDEGSAHARTRLIMLFSKQLLSTPDEHEYLQAYYDEVSRRFIESMYRAVPGADADDAAWGYNYMVGIVVFTLAGTAMTARVPDDILRHLPADTKTDQTLDRLKKFICAGVEAIGGRSGA